MWTKLYIQSKQKPDSLTGFLFKMQETCLLTYTRNFIQIKELIGYKKPIITQQSERVFEEVIKLDKEVVRKNIVAAEIETIKERMENKVWKTSDMIRNTVEGKDLMMLK